MRIVTYGLKFLMMLISTSTDRLPYTRTFRLFFRYSSNRLITPPLFTTIQDPPQLRVNLFLLCLACLRFLVRFLGRWRWCLYLLHRKQLKYRLTTLCWFLHTRVTTDIQSWNWKVLLNPKSSELTWLDPICEEVLRNWSNKCVRKTPDSFYLIFTGLISYLMLFLISLYRVICWPIQLQSYLFIVFWQYHKTQMAYQNLISAISTQLLIDK